MSLSVYADETHGMSEVDRAASALFHLDPSCPREEWARIGMAAKAAGLNFDDFHSWSEPAHNYLGEKDCRTAWNSFSEDGPITASTLYRSALDQGWKDPLNGQHAIKSTRANKTVTATPKAPVTQIKQPENTKAVDIWKCCEPASANHAYIVRKRGLPDGLRIYPNEAPPLIIRDENVAGWLVVPCRDLNGNLQTLQFIPEQGNKLNLPGASFGNGCHVLGEIADLIYIVEGIGQAWAVHAVTDAATVVCFGAGRMRRIAVAIREKYPTALLVLVPDRGKEPQAEAIAAAVNGEWVVMPADKPTNYDANDYVIEYGADALADLLAHPKTPPMRFKLLSGAELSNAPPMRWMVRGVLPLEGLAALYGPSGSGKSFLMLDIAASIAGGAYEWFGRRVTQCAVTYCALEGECGMGKRVKAWGQHHKKPLPDTMRFITQSFDLLNPSDVNDLAKAVQSVGGIGGLVILDTLNRAAPGADENSSVDMGNIIAAAKRLQSLTGGLVLLVHHTGKDATKGLRGHSSLYAALDGAIEVIKTDTRREWSVAKSKDDETGGAHAFKLEVVTVGFDEEGEEITSCVAVADDSVGAMTQVKLPRGGNQMIALNVLAEPLRTSCEFNKNGAPAGHPCIRLDEAISLVAERMVCEAKHKTSRAREAINGLYRRGIYGVKGDWLWRN
jgi:putative DNA primase/helicase